MNGIILGQLRLLFVILSIEKDVKEAESQARCSVREAYLICSVTVKNKDHKIFL